MCRLEWSFVYDYFRKIWQHRVWPNNLFGLNAWCVCKRGMFKWFYLVSLKTVGLQFTIKQVLWSEKPKQSLDRVHSKWRPQIRAIWIKSLFFFFYQSNPAYLCWFTLQHQFKRIHERGKDFSFCCAVLFSIKSPLRPTLRLTFLIKDLKWNTCTHKDVFKFSPVHFQLIKDFTTLFNYNFPLCPSEIRAEMRENQEGTLEVKWLVT